MEMQEMTIKRRYEWVKANKFGIALAYSYRWPAALDTLARQCQNLFCIALAYSYLCR